MRKLTILFLMLLPFFASCSKDEVIAKVGGTKITVSKFKEKVAQASYTYASYLESMAGKKQFLDLMVRESVVLEKAKRAGVERSKEYKQAVNEIIKRQQQELKARKDEILLEVYLKDLQTKTINAAEEEIKKYYETNKKEYLEPVQTEAKHILLSTREDAEKALAMIKKGEDFGKVAEKMSIDAMTAAKGGILPPFKKGDLVKEFEAAIMSLKNGQVSGIVETQFGFHIIKKIKDKKLPEKTFGEARAEIARFIEKEKFDSWFEVAKKKLGVDINYDMLNKLQDEKPETQMPQAIENKSEQGEK